MFGIAWLPRGNKIETEDQGVDIGISIYWWVLDSGACGDLASDGLVLHGFFGKFLNTCPLLLDPLGPTALLLPVGDTRP